jgi:hypothetical protein
MRDAALRAIVEEDLVNVARCLDAGAWKAAALLAGGACEGMLLDVLERNAIITKGYLGNKAADFPDKTSLEQLIYVAKQEGLIQALALSFAPGLQQHRDLIHPNRARKAPPITQDVARSAAHSVNVVAEALHEAAKGGLLTAFEKK